MELIIIFIILIFICQRNKNSNYHYSNKKTNRRKPKQREWNSEWTWDENKQTWVHPLSDPVSINTQQRENEPLDENIEYSSAYQSKYLLTKNEWFQYKRLKEIADIKGYVVCPKVRLFDIIEPKSGHKKYKTLKYKIQAKHVDFVICDRNMQIKAIVELDDNSHNTTERKERDAFVDLILRSVGYKVIHTKYITNDILDCV